MTNLCQDGISIFGKSDGIDYCDFHYHGITIILIYFPTLLLVPSLAFVDLGFLPSRLGKIFKYRHAHSACMYIE